MIDVRYFFASLLIIIFGTSGTSFAYVIGEEKSQQTISTKEIEIFNNHNEYEALISQTKKTLQKDNKPVEKNKNNNLSLLGIGLTSILFVTILIFLFKEDKKTVAKQEYNEDLGKLNVVSKNDEILETEELVFQPNFSKLNVSEEKDLSVEKLKTSKLSENIIAADTSKVEIHGDQPTVTSDVMGKLTIETTSTTEIDVVFELIQDLQNNSNPDELTRQKHLRRKAIWELGQTNDFRAIMPLVQIISRVNSLEKNLILDAITKIANHSLKTINNVLLASLEDESVEVRKNAIQDLTAIYQSMSSITIHLSKMTEDSDNEVQETAVWALEQFKQMSVPVTSIDYAKKRE